MWFKKKPYTFSIYIEAKNGHICTEDDIVNMDLKQGFMILYRLGGTISRYNVDEIKIASTVKG